MKTILGLTAIAIYLSSAAVSHAMSTLWTTGLFNDAATNAYCVVTNVTSKTITVGIDVFDTNGVNVSSQTLQVGSQQTAASNANSIFGTVCRFTVPSKNAVRANVCMSNSGASTCLNSEVAR